MCLFANGTADGDSSASLEASKCDGGGCGGGGFWSMIRWILIHSFIHEIQWVPCLLRDSRPNVLAGFIVTLCVICKEAINCFHLIQIRKRETKESNITGEHKHDHGETSGFASVTYINGLTQFLVCLRWWLAVCVDDRWCSVCRPILCRM